MRRARGPRTRRALVLTAELLVGVMVVAAYFIVLTHGFKVF